VNTRIQKIMDLHGVSASEFADTIGVQRSNVTHVLHERNKPGILFITKILESFPEINAKWLLTGEGEMLEKTKSLPLKQPELFQSTDELRNPLSESSENCLSDKEKNILEDNKMNKFSPLTEERASKTDYSVSEKKEKPRSVEQIVVFYSDNTCKTYRPN